MRSGSWSPWERKHLRDAVAASVGALGLVLGSELKLLLLLLKVHQVPLVLQPGLTPLPELQEQSDCKGRTGGLVTAMHIVKYSEIYGFIYIYIYMLSFLICAAVTPSYPHGDEVCTFI